ncbi:hypothetical protein DEI86_14625 [Curtobacterium sp. MCBD17_028]|nr:hypothetical protein DEI86_14625 [Curtobacterium sp. MCBD17_028]
MGLCGWIEFGELLRSFMSLRRSRARWVTVVLSLLVALLGSVLVSAPAHALNDIGTGGQFVPARGRVCLYGFGIGKYWTYKIQSTTQDRQKKYKAVTQTSGVLSAFKPGSTALACEIDTGMPYGA